jgi:hypothetical protein
VSWQIDDWLLPKKKRTTMAKETIGQITEAGSVSPQSHPSESQNIDLHKDSTRPEQAQEQPGAGAKGILQVAIRKVMQEIEHHENEAGKHLQPAAELRKELRESIAFLHEQGEKGQGWHSLRILVPTKRRRRPRQLPGAIGQERAANRGKSRPGVVAKRHDGRYKPGKRTEAWIKIKPALDAINAA